MRYIVSLPKHSLLQLTKDTNMSFKFNWGHGITLTLAFFVVFIGSFVYKTLMRSEYDHKLISPNYYEEELHYQDEIDSQENANKLKKNVMTSITDSGFKILFPKEFANKNISGHIKMQRSTRDNIDIEKDFVVQDSILLIPKDDMAAGRYHLKLDWEYKGTSYQYRERIDYK